MRQAGHRDNHTYTEYYAPMNPGTDGQGNYFGGTRRTLVNERLRVLTVAWNPEPYQSFPAQKMFDLQQRADFVAIEEQLVELCLGEYDDSEIAGKRKHLRRRRGSLLLTSSDGLTAISLGIDISKDASASGFNTEIGYLHLVPTDL